MGAAIIDIELAEKYGLARTRVADLCSEHLEEGTHYTRTGGKKSYTDEGAARMAELLEEAAKFEKKEGAGDPKTGPIPEKKEPEAERLLRICRVMPARIWIAVDVDGLAVQMRVRDNKNLRVGRRLRCVWTGTEWRPCEPHIRPIA